jgi:hypothetical protein
MRVIPTSSGRRNPAVDKLKMRNTVQLSSDDPAKPQSELSDRPKFNVVIVYEDVPPADERSIFTTTSFTSWKTNVTLVSSFGVFRFWQFQRLGNPPCKSQAKPTSSFSHYMAKLGFLSRLESGLKLGPG